MRAPASTLEVVQAWALGEPGRTALREDDVELTYAQFANALLQCARHLQRLGVQRGQRVAVAGPGLGIQLAVLLACEALGAVTASFLAEGDPDADFLFTQVDWVFAARAQAVPAGVGFGLLDAAWVDLLARAYEGAEPEWSPAQPEEHARMLRTSGSSGASKFMLLRRRVQENWVHPPLDVFAYRRDARLLPLGPLVINAIYGRCCQCLRAGGVLLAGDPARIAQLAPTDLFGLPLQLQQLLAQVPPGYVAPKPVHVATVGGLASPALRERSRAVFRSELLNRYGCNEVHLVCDAMDAAGTGLLAPGVDLRIVDDRGAALPPGQVGVITVRTPSMAEGYLDRPEESAAAFRDGWFVTGDVGVQVGRRWLRVLGRHDDLVNLGGLKVPAARLEDALCARAGIADAAVLAAHPPDGSATLGIAVVAAGGATQEQVLREVQQALALEADAHARILVLSAIPRLPTGKTDRMALLRLFQSVRD
jgi:acyl-CoA synthetase (AMP-forming)/AMP-acid ligase II